MAYDGKERRRHKVYVTRSTEYHLSDGVCVAVRDRRSGAFRDGHVALRLKIQGHVRVFANGGFSVGAEDPAPGDALFFNDPSVSGFERQIVTSRVERVERPAKEIVMRYAPALQNHS